MKRSWMGLAAMAGVLAAELALGGFALTAKAQDKEQDRVENAGKVMS